MKKLVVLLSVTAVATLASGCGRQCKKAREEIITPVSTVMTYLQTAPSGQELASSGCGMMLGQLGKLPAGSNTMRRIAETRFSHTNSYCLNWQHSTRIYCDYYKAGPLVLEEAPEEKTDFELAEILGDDGDDKPYNPRPGRPGLRPNPPYRPPVYRPNPPIYRPHPIYRPVPRCYPRTYTYCAQWQYDTVREPGYAMAMQLSTDLDSLFAQAHAVCGDAASGNLDQAQTGSRQLLAFITAQVKPQGDTVYAQACR